MQHVHDSQTIRSLTMAGYGVASTRWFGSPGGKMGCLGGTLRLYPQTSFLGELPVPCVSTGKHRLTLGAHVWSGLRCRWLRSDHPETVAPRQLHRCRPTLQPSGPAPACPGIAGWEWMGG